MGSLCRRIAKPKKLTGRKIRQRMRERCKKYTSFNIFTRDGRNLTVTSERPMTIIEAQYRYNALSISGND